MGAKLSDFPAHIQEQIAAAVVSDPPPVVDTPPEKAKGFFAAKGAGATFQRSKVEDRTLDGVVFDSKFEMLAFQAIRDLVDPRFLHKQPPFILLPKKTIVTRGEVENMRLMTWKADFLIGPAREHAESPLSDAHLVIDVKGHPSPQFEVRLKVFKWRYETIPLIVNVNSKKRLAAFVETVREHCEKWNYLL